MFRQIYHHHIQQCENFLIAKCLENCSAYIVIFFGMYNGRELNYLDVVKAACHFDGWHWIFYTTFICDPLSFYPTERWLVPNLVTVFTLWQINLQKWNINFLLAFKKSIFSPSKVKPWYLMNGLFSQYCCCSSLFSCEKEGFHQSFFWM